MDYGNIQNLDDATLALVDRAINTELNVIAREHRNHPELSFDKQYTDLNRFYAAIRGESYRRHGIEEVIDLPITTRMY